MSFQIAKSLLFLLFIAAFPLFIFAQTPAETPTSLETNKSIERQIKGGETHSYLISLPQGQIAEIELEQLGIDVILRTFEIDGKAGNWFDRSITKDGLEKASILAESNGSYRLDVEVKLKSASQGGYKLRISAIRETTEKDRQYKKSDLLIKESDKLFEAGKFKEGIPFAKEALEIRQKMYPEGDVEIATTKSNLANLYLSSGDLNNAEPLYLSVIEIWEKAFGINNINVAAAMSNLANVYLLRGDFAKSETLLLRVVEIREKLLGRDHTLVAGAYNTLGRVYRRLEKIDKAIQSYETALDIRQRVLGKDHPATANVLQNLSTLYYFNGDYAKSQVLDEQVIAIFEKTLGPNHANVAGALENLGLSYVETKNFDKAEALYLRALSIHDKSFGVDSIQSASALINLGVLYFETNQYSKSEGFLSRAIKIREPDLLNEPLDFANLINSSGVLYGEIADYSKSESLLLRTIEIYTKYLGENHREVAKVYNNLARMYALKGDVTKAFSFQQKGITLNEKSLDAMLQIGSERQKIDYLKSVSSFRELAIALNVRFGNENADASENGLNSIFQNKGRALDAVTNSIESLRKHIRIEDEPLLVELTEINKQLAENFSGNSTKISASERKKQLEVLNEKKEKLEIQISRLSAAYYAPAGSISASNIRTNIPKESSLIEFSLFRPFERKISTENPYHYAVYIVKREGKIEVADLGEAKEIDALITKFRNALQDPKNVNIKQLARDLDKKLMSPIRGFLGDSTQLLISPDGDLNLIPFEALVDESGKYLVEKYSISYLSSGRDLLRMQNSKPNPNSPLIITNPDFGVSQIVGRPENITVSKRDKRRNVNVANSLAETYFLPLSGTEQEGKSIQTLFPESTLLTGSKATKDALKQAKSPSILHIATHGFYLEDKEKSSTENPLLRSGIALAGANARTSNDGIVTALEATGLNLFGTKLVVLSACGTGLGEVQSGEGVFGLRRSFVLSGTESLVISLWSVSDYVTRELMTNYYKNLKQGTGRGESLRKVQLGMLKNPKRQHPFYWASFIQSGNWKALDK
jgi:CHAT domain-containing protein/tetratricopeptide (TPR) repeat protein